MNKQLHNLTSNPVSRLEQSNTSLSKKERLCLIKGFYCMNFMCVILNSHYEPFGHQMYHLDDAFTLCLTIIIQVLQALCVNMFGVCRQARGFAGKPSMAGTRLPLQFNTHKTQLDYTWNIQYVFNRKKLLINMNFNTGVLKRLFLLNKCDKHAYSSTTTVFSGL